MNDLLVKPESPTAIEAADATQRGPRWLFALVVVILSGFLLVAHGCHGGDQDHELFTSHVSKR